MKKEITLFILLLLIYGTLRSQVIINEGSYRNYAQITIRMAITLTGLIIQYRK
jgi:hypothetical protein